MVNKFSSLLILILLSYACSQSLAAPITTQDKPFNIVQAQAIYSYSFGYWPVGSIAYQDFSFTSYRGSLVIYSIYTYGVSFNSIDNCPYHLYDRSRCSIRVYFNPWGVGYQSGETHINTSDGTSYIYFSGYGY